MTGEIHSVGPFILGKSLGSGATGKVKLGFHKDTGFKVAIKIMNKEVLSSRPSMRKKVEREIVVMKLIDHPNVLKLHDVYETSKYLFLVTEYVEGGELFDYLINKGSLEPAEALRFFQQIIRGLDHCHNQRICHRDLKPENLLLDADKNIKIGDFGMAALMRRGTLLSTSCGSPHYASPEVVTGKHYSGMASDIWSCGVILYALLTGKLPFDDDDIRKLLSKVKSGQFSMPALLPATVRDLIQRMLTVDPSKRITMAQIKEHKWYTSNMSDPLSFVTPVSVEDMVAEPLEDAAAIDDEILRSLKVLGLGSDMDIEHSLTSRISNIALVFYRLLQERKLKQSTNSYNNRANRSRSNAYDMRERSFSEHTQGPNHQEGKARSNSISQESCFINRVPSLHSQQRRPSPLVGSKRSNQSELQALVFPLSPSNSASSTNSHSGGSTPTTTFSVSDDTASVMSIAISTSSEIPTPLQLSPRASPQTRTSPREKEKSKYKKSTQSPPASPPMSTLQGHPPSSPISIAGNKSRVMKLASEVSASPSCSSPIIGSNPKRSFFSNFFTGSPRGHSFLDDDSSGPNLTIRDAPASPHLSHNHNPQLHHRDHNGHQSNPNSPNINLSHGYSSPRREHLNNNNSHHNYHASHAPQSHTAGFQISNGSSNNDATSVPSVLEHSRTSMEMQTFKSGIELGAEIQRTLCALKTSWRLHTNELYTAKFDGTEGKTCQFSIELVDLKNNKLNLISVSHIGGTSSFFDTLCSQFQAEVKL